MKNIKLVLFVALSTLSFVLNAQKVLTYSKAGTVTIDCYQGGFLPTAECKTCALSGDKEYHNGLIIKRGSTVVARVNSNYNWKITGDQIVFYWWTQNSTELNSYTVRVSETGYLKINDIVAAVQGCQDSGSGGGGAVTSVNGQTGAVVIPVGGANLGYNSTTRIITNSNGTSATLPLASGVVDGLMPLTDKQKLDLVTVTSAVNLNNLLSSNTAITGATKTKITYDSKGLVTAGADATASDILNVASGTIAATNVQSAITELNNEKVNLSDYTGKGTILSASATAGQPVGTSVGSDGQVLVANSGTTSGLSWATLPAATAVQFQNQGTNVGTAGQANTYNFTGSGVTTAVAGAMATVTINSSSILNYSAGNGATVVATGAGVTFTRTTASVWTFAIPTGVRLLSFNIYSTTGENMGATSTLVFDYTGNTLTNQGATTAEPPTLTVYQDGGGGMNQLVVGGSATSAFRPAISAVGSGDITLLSQSGSIASTGATIIKGQF